MLQIYKSPSVQVEEGGSTHDVPYSAQPSHWRTYSLRSLDLFVGNSPSFCLSCR